MLAGAYTVRGASCVGVRPIGDTTRTRNLSLFPISPAGKKAGITVDTLLHHIGSLALFAEKAADNPAGKGGDSPIMQLVVPFVAIGFLFYFLLYRPQKAEQKRRLEMLQGVKKNDRVITTGGIYGIVTNVQREDNEVTIKVDESTNTKLRVTLGDIRTIVVDEPSGESAKK